MQFFTIREHGGMIADMWRKIKNSVLLNTLFLCLVVVVAVGAVRITRETTVLRREARKGEEEIVALTARKAELEARITELETPEAIEREAKEKLNLKKRGETVVVVVPENPADQNASVQSGAWGSVLNFFSEMFGRAARLFGDR